MSTILLHNFRLLVPGSPWQVTPSARILVENGRISRINPEAVPEDATAMDCQGRTALPAMINAHTHLYSALAIGMPWPSAPMPTFTDILKQIWWKLDRSLDEDSTRASFRSGLLECLRSGVTTVVDHHSSQSWIRGSLQLLVDCALELGLRISPTFEITDRNGPAARLAAIAENLDCIRRYHDHPRVAPKLGLHASFTIEDETLKAIARARDEVGGAGIHIHLAEDQADQEDARQRGYKGVVQRLDHFGLLDAKALVIHGIHLAPEEEELLLKRNCMLVHNPSSNANNRVGQMDVTRCHKLRAGLGTDGMQADLLREAKEGMLITSASLPGGDASIDYVALLFDHNPTIAERLFSGHPGRILEGEAAELVFFDYHERTPLTAENAAGHLLFGLGRPSDLFLSDHFVLHNHQLQIPNASEILEDSRRCAQQLWHKMTELPDPV